MGISKEAGGRQNNQHLVKVHKCTNARGLAAAVPTYISMYIRVYSKLAYFTFIFIYWKRRKGDFSLRSWAAIFPFSLQPPSKDICWRQGGSPENKRLSPFFTQDGGEEKQWRQLYSFLFLYIERSAAQRAVRKKPPYLDVVPDSNVLANWVGFFRISSKSANPIHSM